MFEMNRTLKEKGDQWELLVAEYYQNKGHILLQHKYTIHWGELDLIFENDELLTFVEVKVVDYIDDFFDYITPKKLWTVKRTMERYLLNHPNDKPYVLDVVFVKNNSIVEIYENVTNT